MNWFLAGIKFVLGGLLGLFLFFVVLEVLVLCFRLLAAVLGVFLSSTIGIIILVAIVLALFDVFG